MIRFAILIPALVLVGTNVGSAQNRCHTQGDGILDFSQNSNLTYHSMVERDGCRFSYALDQSGYNLRLGRSMLAKLEIMRSPQNGQLDRIGEFSIIYRPKQNFSGKDSFVVYLCGEDSRGKGCSRLNYEITVK